MDRLSRPAIWNLFLTVLVLSCALVAHLAGTPWRTVGVVLSGAVLLGTVLALVVNPLSRRRMQSPGAYVPAEDRPAPEPVRTVRPVPAIEGRAA